jgi:hypothetical protein
VDAFATQHAEARAAALDAAARALAAVPNIAAAGRTDGFAEGCERATGLVRAICFALVPDEAGELYVYPVAGSLITNYTEGTGHDAPFADNQRVPILVKAPGVAPRTVQGSLLQVAPTLAALLGIPPPPAARAEPLVLPRKRSAATSR